MTQGSNAVIDPVCGMTVDPKKAAATRVHEGTTYYFCSGGCAKQFDTDPHRFAHQADSGHKH
jgi:Cu+-exporting ATPase